MESKYSKYQERILELFEDNPRISTMKIAKQLHFENDELKGEVSSQLRRYISQLINGTPVEHKPTEFVKVKEKRNGWGEVTSTTHRKQTTEFVDIPASHEIKRLSTNLANGQQWVITQPKDWSPEDDDFDYLGELAKQLDGYKPDLLFDLPRVKREGVITVTDLHFGAYISAMTINPEFNISILCGMLERSAEYVNRIGYSKVHVFVLGDLIESFTGLNHKNSWKGLDKGMFGVSAIKLFTELFSKHFLEKIANLGSIKMVAGNHDRVTSDNNEDVDGGAAEMIAWGLELMKYDVEFNPAVMNVVVDGVSYILNHGHLYLTKKKTAQELAWMYGQKGMFNFILEGHLHSRMRKLSANQVSKFQMVMDDTVDTRRQVCPPLFTGNAYSEYGGWSTNPGVLVIENNGYGVPHVFDFSLAEQLNETA